MLADTGKRPISMLGILHPAAAGLFLAANLAFRYASLTATAYQLMPYLLLCLCAVPIVIVWSAKTDRAHLPILKTVFYCLGFSFFLFGFHSYSIKNQLFEYALAMVAVSIFLDNLGQRKKPLNKTSYLLSFLVIFYVASMALYPWKDLCDHIALQGVFAFAVDTLSSPPNATVHYSLAGANRLLLFFVLVMEMSANRHADEIYPAVFKGVFAGTVVCLAIGFLDYSRLVDFRFYNMRLLDSVFTSTFLNKGWFAEYLIVTFPFALLYAEKNGLQKRLAYYVFLPLCGLALVLSASRSSWLAFPAVLFLMFHLRQRYFSQGDPANRQGRPGSSKKFVWISTIAVLTVFAIFMLAGNSGINSYVEKHYGHTLADRLANFTKSERPETWLTAYEMFRESPLFGLGYESYRNNIQALYGIENSRIRKNVVWKHYRDTAHNTYVQILSSNGIIGLMLYLTLIVSCLLRLIFQIRKHHDIISLCCFSSLIGFHIYAVFQSMQYISVIWLILFINIGYALTLEDERDSVFSLTAGNVVILASCLFTLWAMVFYVSNTGFANIKERYGISTYVPEDRDNYIGFYPFEKWPDGHFAWMSTCGRVIPASTNQTELTLHCAHPDVSKNNPVVVTVASENFPPRTLEFTAAGRQVLHNIPTGSGTRSAPLEICVSRTWSPRAHNNSPDFRTLGVAIKRLGDEDK